VKYYCPFPGSTLIYRLNKLKSLNKPDKKITDWVDFVMMRVTFFLPLLLCVAFLMLAGCDKRDDAKRIADAIAVMQQGIEQKQAKVIAARLTQDFQATGEQGTTNIQVLMPYYFRQHRHISVFISDQEIRVTGDRADVTLEALLVGREDLLPEQGQRYAVAMRWHKLNDEWKLSRLKWQRIEQ